MKRILFVAIAVFALVFLMAGVAFAEDYGLTYGSTADTSVSWLSGQGANGDGYYAAPSGNPHGGFDVGTHNCDVCHSVHHADSTGEALLGDTVADACTYCHINSDTGYIRIYNNDETAYDGSNSALLDFGHQSPGGATCTACHQVHAATSQMVSDPTYGADGAGMQFLVTKLLKVTGDGTDMTDSHDAALSLAADTDPQVAVSMWCTTCHANGLGQDSYGYFNQGYDSPSHVMGDATTSYQFGDGSTGRIAQSGSNTCGGSTGCHNQGEVNVAPDLVADPSALPVQSAYNFPHLSQGVRFLSAVEDTSTMAIGPATDAHADGVCMSCHRGDDVMGSGG